MMFQHTIAAASNVNATPNALDRAVLLIYTLKNRRTVRFGQRTNKKRRRKKISILSEKKRLQSIYIRPERKSNFEEKKRTP
jgi:hypothetical protein